MNDQILTPRRPYLLRAFYDWLVENDLTPYIVVDATLPHVDVPQEYVKDGQIILNIAMRAVSDLALGNDKITFSARFGGMPISMDIPLYAITAIYARENGVGTMFDSEPAYEVKLAKLAKIHMVEGDDLEIEALEDNSEHDETTISQSTDESKPKGKPTLTVVK